MKSSAFSGLSLTEQGAPLANGVDQRLFAPARERTESGPLETMEPRANAPTLSRDNETTRTPTNAGIMPRTRPATSGPSRPRSTESARPPSGERAPARTVERHSHNIFQDQIRWMNRVKLDLEERYDVRVTGNAMVQLALDLFREDFIRNGEGSSLIRILVHGDPRRPETDGASGPSRAGEEADR